jgi:hypothetical protein
VFRRPRDISIIIAAAGLVGLIVYVAAYLLQSEPPRDQFGQIIGRDFVNTWMGAKTVLEGHAREVLQVGLHMRRLIEALGPMPPHNWSYPPALFLFIWPLGYLPYLAACAVWSIVGYAVYLLASASHDRRARYLLFVAAAPAIAVNLCSGQTGFFTAAILILVFRYLDERPLLAGALLGLMLCKPHLVVLFPLALTVSGRWRVIAATAIATSVLITATALVFGSEIWSDYFRFVLPVQRGVLDTGTGFLTMMPTGFIHARMLGASNTIAWMVQAPFTVLALSIVVWTFAKRRDPLLSAGVLLTASVIAVPYAFAYDMVVFGWLIPKLWPRLPSYGDRGLLLVVWSLPVTMMGMGDLGLPLAAPILAIFLIRLAFLVRGRASQLPL